MSNLTYTDSEGVERDARTYLESDRGDAPGSRYGTSWRDYVPVALAVARIYADSAGELTSDTLDGAVSLVVNDSPEPAIMIADYGTDDERQLLDADVLADAVASLEEQS